MTISRHPHKRISLPCGCSLSVPSVHPSNWNQAGAFVVSDWYIHYRFYDPSIKPGQKFFKGKQCIVKGMNNFKILSDRREITKKLLANELNLLEVRGYNPITGQFSIAMGGVDDISDRSPLLPSLRSAFEMLKCDPITKSDVKSTLNILLLQSNNYILSACVYQK